MVDSPESGERAQEVADRAVTLVKDSGDSLPIRHPENLCVIAMTERRRSQQGIRLIEEVKKRAPNVTVDGARSDDEQNGFGSGGEKASSCSQIVAAAYVTVSAYRGNVALAGGYPDFLSGLIAGKAPVMLVSLGNPYLVRSLPERAPLSDYLQPDAHLGDRARQGAVRRNRHYAAVCR